MIKISDSRSQKRKPLDVSLEFIRHLNPRTRSNLHGDQADSTPATSLRPPRRALFAITEAYRLDDQGKLDPGDLQELAGRLAQVSSAFPLEQIVLRAIERRVKALKLSSRRRSDRGDGG